MEDKMKKIVFLVIVALVIPSLFAQDDTDVTTSSTLLLQISTLPELKLGYIHSFNFPFLQGDNPLTEGNNITLNLTAEVSPVSVNGIVEAIWTPIAFVELAAGGRIGTGWPLLNFFDGDLYGIGLNNSYINDRAEYSGSAFESLLWKVHLGGAFQFDLAALFPGEWNHVIVRTYHEINYHANTRANNRQSWYFENDDGENLNGFNYYGNFLIGYQMPLVLNMVALLAEMDLYLYDTPGRTKWGDDMIRWTFSGILNFGITEQLSLTLIAQFETKRNFLESNWEDLHYSFRTLNTSNPQRIEFYRVAAAITYRF
jgi:hypothetical protein